ncbi:MAG: oxidoreductase [Methanocorpusculum sp.]|nr:oxidoreductase [Methanocorpusculum sp.]MDE2522469.1 oxidoreductase [Methanocorpusculum sp.]MDE2523535.1 oxidoreductase [Methanocorpusculum sp.]
MAENTCANPVWPCAMTGAVATLAGFPDICVIIHGSSGCYYYPRSLLKVPLFSTYLLESEIVFGTIDRLHEVVTEVAATGRPIAVVNTCVPALTGEDLKTAFSEETAMFVDAPGFCGNAEQGAVKAFEAMMPDVAADRAGINIDGINLLDLFWRGNLHETERLLALLGIPVAVRFCHDTWKNLRKGAAPVTVSANSSYASGVGTCLGSMLFPDMPKTIDRCLAQFPNADADAVLAEHQRAEEQMFYSCDKYLRKYTPPVVAVAAQESYAVFAKAMMERYFGSDVPVIFARDRPAPEVPYSVNSAEINADIAAAEPDLILGSTFEAATCRKAAFFGITPPDRSRVSVAARPLVGVEGGLVLIEGALNALMNRHAAEEKKR